jgi:hypothetical protein
MASKLSMKSSEVKVSVVQALVTNISCGLFMRIINLFQFSEIKRFLIQVKYGCSFPCLLLSELDMVC